MPDDPSMNVSSGDMWMLVAMIVPMFIFYLLSCPGVGIIAKTRGRSFLGWTLLSLIITPIIAGFIVFIMQPLAVIRKSPPPM